MQAPYIARFGTWKSPVTSDLIASATIGLGQTALDGPDIYWTESRPAEGGRIVVVRRSSDGTMADVNPAPYNVRTRVHEYGGGAFVVAEGAVYGSHFADQRMYRMRPGEEPVALTPAVEMRYADAVVDRVRRRLICVAEDHTVADREAVNTIVAVPFQGGATQTLVAGNDFYSSPRVSPDGTQLAWLTWNHPNMPWDGTELWVGRLEAGGGVTDARRVAGGVDEAIVQPEWSPDGTLYFISDRSGWWNLYRQRDGVDEALCPMEAEFGFPHWVFGQSMYAFAEPDPVGPLVGADPRVGPLPLEGGGLGRGSPDRLVCTFAARGRSQLALLDTATLHLDPIDVPYTSISGLRVASGRAVFIGGSPNAPSAVVTFDLATQQIEILRRAGELDLDERYLSTPEPIEFPTTGGLTAHAYFYRARNPDFMALEDERPPLLVMSHGGPTGSTSTALRLSIQYWTSRGIAVLDVNYGGSTGYGREYRRRLDGAWGVVDVDDCVNGARYLVERGDVDGERLAITGGSAGGYTTLCALTFRDTFKAGASYYGIGDLEALAHDTHKFESRYEDRLVGPYPEAREVYFARSPINFPQRLSRPTIFFQGLDDKIVPPNQAEMMVDALRRKGVPVAYLPFEGEQHGFRRAENIKRALDAELYFYGRIFGFTPADDIEPVHIENL